jgi:nucleoside-diphosphate-sugar epimerase
MIESLKGPILVLGASGFIGANLFKKLLRVRQDVFGTCFSQDGRLHGTPNVIKVDLTKYPRTTLDQVKPATVFDLITYGAYASQDDTERIYDTNVVFKTRLMELLYRAKVQCYIHAGSSSEYGEQADGPSEDSPLLANSHYAVSKAATSALIHYWGKHRGMRCANLRLYSVYGPLEDGSRLIPKLVSAALEGTYPPLVDHKISRDFVYVEDVCDAFVRAATHLPPLMYGHSFNVGTGVSTTIGELASITKNIFSIDSEPSFSTMPDRAWDFYGKWRANTDKTYVCLDWKSKTKIEEGLLRYAERLRNGLNE